MMLYCGHELFLLMIVYYILINRKARRKEKDSTGGPPVSGVGYGGVGGFGSNEDGKLGKLYLETALLERHLNETDLKHLVEMPTGLEENEWMASHSTDKLFCSFNQY